MPKSNPPSKSKTKPKTKPKHQSGGRKRAKHRSTDGGNLVKAGVGIARRRSSA